MDEVEEGTEEEREWKVGEQTRVRELLVHRFFSRRLTEEGVLDCPRACLCRILTGSQRYVCRRQGV